MTKEDRSTYYVLLAVFSGIVGLLFVTIRASQDHDAELKAMLARTASNPSGMLKLELTACETKLKHSEKQLADQIKSCDAELRICHMGLARAEDRLEECTDEKKP
jgi:hypothetical protein